MKCLLSRISYNSAPLGTQTDALGPWYTSLAYTSRWASGEAFVATFGTFFHLKFLKRVRRVDWTLAPADVCGMSRLKIQDRVKWLRPTPICNNVRGIAHPRLMRRAERLGARRPTPSTHTDALWRLRRRLWRTNLKLTYYWDSNPSYNSSNLPSSLKYCSHSIDLPHKSISRL